MEDVDAGWRFVSIGLEGEATDVGGINPWEAEWTPTHGRITVAHPQYPSQRHTMFTYEVAGVSPPVVFAAGEFSNGVWGFFAHLETVISATASTRSMTDAARVERRWPGAIVRADANRLRETDLPDDAIHVLATVGLPRRVDPIFEATELAEVEAGRERKRLWQFGSDVETVLAIDPRSGAVVSASRTHEYPERYVNEGLPAFVAFLVEVSEVRKGLVALDDGEADARIALLTERLRQLDPSALTDPDSWWSTIVEQMRDGLL